MRIEITTVTLLTLAAVGPAAAQGLNLEILPKVGVFTPIGGLTPNTELRPSLAYGVAGEITLAALPFAVRANVDVAHDSEIRHRTAAEARVGGATVTTLVGDLVLRPLPRTALLQPYFLGGAGVKRYELDLETAGGGELSGVDNDLSSFTVHVGGGVDFRLGPLALVLEVGDYISSFTAANGEKKLQNDLFGLLGFRVGMF